MIIPDEDLQSSPELRLSSSVVTAGKIILVSILAINLNDHAIIFTKNKQLAVLQFLSPQDEEDFNELGLEFLAPKQMKNGEVLREISQLMRVGKTRGGRQPIRPPPEYDKIWFATQLACQNADDFPALQRKTFDNIAGLQKRDLLDPQNNERDKKTFLASFDRLLSALKSHQISEMPKF